MRRKTRNTVAQEELQNYILQGEITPKEEENLFGTERKGQLFSFFPTNLPTRFCALRQEPMAFLFCVRQAGFWCGAGIGL